MDAGINQRVKLSEEPPLLGAGDEC